MKILCHNGFYQKYITIVRVEEGKKVYKNFILLWMFYDKTGEKLTILFSAVFYDNQICELIHAILHLTDTHAVSHSQSPEVKHTHTHTMQTDIF